MHVVIVEDETVVARRIERIVRQLLGAELSHVDVVTGLSDALTLLERLPTAVVLLDLNLSGKDGFDILRRAVAEPFRTIVISANTDRAVEAFELGVVDFVPKPFTVDRLAKAIERVTLASRAERPPAFLAVTLAGRVDLVPIASIVAIHGADDYSELETADGRKLLHKKSLSTLEGMLPADYQRVHRSHMVNLGFAVRLTRNEAGRHVLLLSNGSRIPLSRSGVSALKRALKDRKG